MSHFLFKKINAGEKKVFYKKETFILKKAPPPTLKNYKKKIPQQVFVSFTRYNYACVSVLCVGEATDMMETTKQQRIRTLPWGNGFCSLKCDSDTLCNGYSIDISINKCYLCSCTSYTSVLSCSSFYFANKNQKLVRTCVWWLQPQRQQQQQKQQQQRLRQRRLRIKTSHRLQ